MWKVISISFCSFQKGSPFLEDINYLIGISDQMGDSLGKQVYQRVPNMTKWLTWNAVEKSHMTQDNKVVVKLDDIYGLLLILALGLFGAMILISTEIAVKALKRKNKKRPSVLEVSGAKIY